MEKKPDANDKTQQDPVKAKEEFEAAEQAAQQDPLSNILNIGDYNPDLAIINELNSKHTFIENLGGKSAVSIRTYSEVTEREEIDFISLETFKNIYMNRTIAMSDGKNTRLLPIAVHWLTDTRRNTVNSITFDPSTDSRYVEAEGKRYLNLWDGFGIKEKKGCWKKTRKHIWKILCNSDRAKFKYVIRWLAFCVQKRETRAEVALVFKGEQGGGKSFLFVQIKKIFGSHGMVVSDPNRLVGKFNNHFRSLCFLFCDEAYFPGDKEVEGVMKARITEEFIDTEAKGRDPITLKNRLHIAMCTNKELVIPATKDARRFFIEEINNMYAKGRAPDDIRKKYFDPLFDEMDKYGGREAMLYDLMRININGWCPRDHVPQTQELAKQIVLNFNSLQQAVKEMLETGILPAETNKREIPNQDEYLVLSANYTELIEKLEPHCIKFSSVKKADIIKELGAIKQRQPRTGKVLWSFPELKVMRRNWDKKFGPNAWDEQEKWTLIKSNF